MSMAANTLKLNFPCKWGLPNNSSRRLKLLRCMPVQQQDHLRIYSSSEQTTVTETDVATFSASLPGAIGYGIVSVMNIGKKPVHLQSGTNHIKVDSGIMCESCSGRGWLLCDFCNGQKTNVKAEKNRIYRRCPACRATGCILCSKCKVFRCVTFPDHNDGDELIL